MGRNKIITAKQAFRLWSNISNTQLIENNEEDGYDYYTDRNQNMFLIQNRIWFKFFPITNPMAMDAIHIVWKTSTNKAESIFSIEGGHGLSPKP
jgi:hypothetical protein